MIVPALWKMLLSRSALSIFNLPVRSKFSFLLIQSDVDCRMQMISVSWKPKPIAFIWASENEAFPTSWEVSCQQRSHCSLPVPPTLKRPPHPRWVLGEQEGNVSSYSLKWPHKIHSLGIIGLEWHILSKSACFPLAIYSRSLFFQGCIDARKGLHANQHSQLCFFVLDNFTHLFLAVLFIAAGFSFVVASRGYSLVKVPRLLIRSLTFMTVDMVSFADAARTILGKSIYLGYKWGLL